MELGTSIYQDSKAEKPRYARLSLFAPVCLGEGRQFMSIDLHTRINGPMKLRPLLPKISNVLRDMLGLDEPVVLTLEVLIDGKRSPAVTDELRDRSTPFFLISIEGEPETVGLLSDGDFLGITMAAQRTNLEYALGAAAAIAAAREFGGKIEDDWGFFGPSGEVSSEDMFEALRIVSKPGPINVRDAAEHLRLGSIDIRRDVVN